MTYYLQISKGSQSLRRYSNGVAQRWSIESKAWVNQCADERSCIITGDRVLTENEAADFIK